MYPVGSTEYKERPFSSESSIRTVMDRNLAGASIFYRWIGINANQLFGHDWTDIQQKSHKKLTF